MALRRSSTSMQEGRCIVGANVLLTPATVEYESEALIEAHEVTVLHDRGLVTPADWKIIRASETTLKVGFAEVPELPPSGPTQAWLQEAGASAVMATTDIPITWLWLERDGAICHVEIAVTADELSRVWSGSITTGGPMDDTPPIGRAGVGGPTAVIDTGDRLVRMTYSANEVPASSSRDAGIAHFRRLEDGARGFLRGMLAAA